MDCKCAICGNNLPFDMPNEIIDAAKKGELAIFCGAGISTENKTVLPYSFYTQICEELSADNTISFCELMQLYCQQPNGRKKLIQKIKERFDYIESFPELSRTANAFHRELSEIHQIKTIITTNWDTYFEDCCGAVPIIIPQDVALLNEDLRHVIKIHGSINNISTIVATKNDYEKCYTSLQNGVIGAKLKSILATKTVVFIGFSFGDDDFSQILSYLKNEMGELFPHIYIVTIDEDLPEKLEYSNSTSIITSGTYFIHRLKLILSEEGYIVNNDIEENVMTALEKIISIHNNTSNINLKSYPVVALTLAYQDGVIHSLERFFRMKKTGQYNNPNYVSASIGGYSNKLTEYIDDYWDYSYFYGYLNGLILIDACEKDNEIIDTFPYLFLPNIPDEVLNLGQYKKELEKISNNGNKYHEYSKSIVEKFELDSDIVIHHPPY